jgi:magnesium-transporting ATPase (P-type)
MKNASTCERQWHSLSPEETLARLEAQPSGLSESEAARRLVEYGSNRLRPPHRRGPFLRFALQFHNILIYVLLAASAVTAVLAHWIDTAVIVGVVVINAVIGFIQEGKAERALEAIRRMLSLHASVKRGGKKSRIPADALVPGDIVFLRSGDKVPADLRLIDVKNLQVQEAVLTGESLAVEKEVAPVPKTAELGDRWSMAYSGTLVTYGQATGVVVATGEATEIGHISSMLAEVKTMATPLLQQLAVFGRWLTLAIIAIAGLTFGFGILVRGYTASDMFLAAVGLAVAAIPEGLPAIMTITLALGVQRMAQRNAIIRRLPAVETLGSLSVICSDKTGTLTRNEMTVQSIATGHNLFEVTGVGYLPVGEFLLDAAEVAIDHQPLLSEMTRGALLCSDASLRQVDEQWIVDGDPTEGALIVVAMKAGLDLDIESKNYPRCDVIPFESERRFMATLHHSHEGHGFAYVKGAPENILEMCDRQRGERADEPLDVAFWKKRMEEIAGRGQRILALATKSVPKGRRELNFGDVEKGLIFVGLFGLADPPRAEAIEAVAQCRSAGIQVKMITGDHGATASAIATQLGLDNPAAVLTGGELDALGGPELASRIEDTNVFARTSPQHKLRLVEALQASGHVVAMTGDGVNDAPALKRADVGVAMGVNGTEAAKEASEMVLVDDNFASIAHAIEEGRTVYDNLKKSIVFILPTSGGEALMIITAIALGQLLPITAIQILWINMITTVTLALSLAFDAGERAVMARSPRKRREPILSGFLAWRIAFVSMILVAGTFGMFVWQREQGASIEFARTAAVNTLVMFEVFYLFNARFLSASSFNRAGIFGSRPVLVAIGIVVLFQLLFTYAPPMQFLFQTAALDMGTWAEIVMIASTVFFLVEVEKFFLRRFWSIPSRRTPQGSFAHSGADQGAGKV